MKNLIKLPQLPWHGPKELVLPVPDEWDIEICNMCGYNLPTLSEEQIKSFLNQPFGTPPIRELAKGKKEVVIIFDDMARGVRFHKIVSAVIDELGKADIPDNKIRFIAASGNHGPMTRLDFIKKIGEAALSRFPVYNHNSYENCVYAGITSRGTKIYLNAEFMSCDFKIAIDSVTPHVIVGFSGGGKIILPGVAHIDSILANHKIPMTLEERKDYDVNPGRLDIEEAAQFAGLDVAIECLVNLWGEAVAIFSGDERLIHDACVSKAKEHYLTPKARDKDIVIGNAYFKSIEAVTALKTDISLKKDGGDFVLIANAPEGQVVHYLMGPWGRSIGGRMRWQVPLPDFMHHCIVYSEYPDIAGLGYIERSERVIPMQNWKDVVDMLVNIHGNKAKVAVYPNADIHYFG